MFKTGPFIQDEKDNLGDAYQSHYRCSVCGYSNFHMHDETVINGTGPLIDRVMYHYPKTGDVICSNCIPKSFLGFDGMNPFYQKDRNKYIPLKNSNRTKIKNAQKDEWDELKAFNKANTVDEWEKILAEENLSPIK